MMVNSINKFVLTVALFALSACVTQSYENNNDTPVIESGSSNNEIAMTRISLGLGYLKMGNTTQAKLNLEKAKRFSPNLAPVYTAFAHYYDTVGEAELAIEAYEKALSLDKNDADTLNNYGVFLCRQQHYEQAEKQLLKAINVPTYVLVYQSYENLALCQLKVNNFVKANAYLEKSIAHNPSSASGLLQMVRLQYAMSNYQAAELYLRRYEKATRRFTPDALSLAYKVFIKQGNVKVAKNYAGMLVKMFPASYEAKQYILNELYRIEADELAEKYQLSHHSDPANNTQKRRIVLSPKNENKPIREKVTKKITSKSPEIILAKDSSSTPKISHHDNNKAAGDVHSAETNERNDKSSSLDPQNTAQISTDEGQNMLTLPIHVVKKGDSLFGISKKYNIQMGSILYWNHIKQSKILHVGDIIYLADSKKMVKSK